VNYVAIYEPFEPQEVSDKIAEMLSSPEIKAENYFSNCRRFAYRLSQTGIGTSPEIIHQGE
jgi:predicted solute-binding protein